MTTIARVGLTEQRLPLHTPFVTALRRTTSTASVLVTITDSDGVTGTGEAPEVWPVTGESLPGIAACVRERLAPVLLGRDPAEYVTLLRRVRRAATGNHGAKAAVDVALHDLAARRLGVPLAVLLGGTPRRVPTDVTVAADSAAVPKGFTVLKVKVGADAAGDLDRIAAVRAAAGPDARIRLDANQAWTPRAAVRMLDRIAAAGLDVEFVEQPVAAADLDGLAWVSERSGIPVMADESVFGVRDLVEVIRRRAADLVNVKLAKCGGLEPARTLLGLAEAQGMGTMVGSMMEGPVGVTAAASLVAAYPTTVVSDLDAAWWLADPVLDYADGHVLL
ncbi:dipeptide epimerase [Actinoplanes ianthinogenes]|uniref:Dipeptide epimerase n=1 Tax=Actinoplanes ianthinogenes TaxID=122358 RepID=A0ABM7M6A8_9ACTN|nr:dipeptide epimerase [Actinoplanes ianthinogenes]BCJ47121.1 dipeptide epimerase [Actinoplanes ianthinogenes]GGR51842.1 dipeptide epimerase [Actinoplanes ianthinogenes]